MYSNRDLEIPTLAGTICTLLLLLGIWKLVDIIWWCIHHIQVSII